MSHIKYSRAECVNCFSKGTYYCHQTCSFNTWDERQPKSEDQSVGGENDFNDSDDVYELEDEVWDKLENCDIEDY